MARACWSATAAALSRDDVRAILTRGGTILGSSRTNPFKSEGGGEECVRAFADLGLDALVAIGGEDTLGVARRLYAEHGLKVVGVPKTIDNDLSGTDFTFGFWTAVQIATDAIDRLHTTAESHDRVIVVEVMGRHAGWIALESGLAGGAHAILIPEQPPSVEAVCDRHRASAAPAGGATHRGRERGGRCSTARPASGEVDDFGHAQLAKAGVGEALAERMSERHRRGGPAGRARARPARRHPHRVRPRHRHPVRRAGRRPGGRGRLRPDGRAAAAGASATSQLSDAVSVLKTVPEDIWRAVDEVVAGPWAGPAAAGGGWTDPGNPVLPSAANASLVICEKPSVAQDVAKALIGPKAKRVGDHWEGQDAIVAFAVGHLVEQVDPDAYDDALQEVELRRPPDPAGGVPLPAARRAGRQDPEVRSTP